MCNGSGVSSRSPLNLQKFPFDQQDFALTLIASNYTPDQVQLIQNPDSPSGIAEVLSIAGWKVQDWQAIPETYQPFDIGPYSAFVLSFTAQRDWRFYTFRDSLSSAAHRGHVLGGFLDRPERGRHADRCGDDQHADSELRSASP